jgi:hypothetical protein
MAVGFPADTGYQAQRLRVTVDAPVDEFRRRYEAAVPTFDADAVAELVMRKADWAEIAARTDASAPHGFLRYWTSDAGALMRRAGDPGECAMYLMGNHIIAERMYRYDPAVLLYAPLRTVCASMDSATTQFSIDRPSAVFASFPDARIAEVGVDLDRKVAALLRFLDAPVPPSLVD